MNATVLDREQEAYGLDASMGCSREDSMAEMKTESWIAGHWTEKLSCRGMRVGLEESLSHRV